MGVLDGDAIALIESIYSLDGSVDDWVSGMASALTDFAGEMTVIVSVGTTEDFLNPVLKGAGKDPHLHIPHIMAGHQYMANQADDLVGRTYTVTSRIATISERMKGCIDDLSLDPFYIERAHPLGVMDMLLLNVTEPDHSFVGIGFTLPQVRGTLPEERWLWERIGAHLSAAFRLRRGATITADDADAILDPDGKLLHVHDTANLAQTKAAALQQATQKREQARGKIRKTDPAQAVDLWRALVDGRFSLVDLVDTDGKRLILARKNEPHEVGTKRLTRRERQVAYLAASGLSNAVIAYELGISASSVGSHLCRAMKKLGVDNRVDLVRLMPMAESNVP